MALNRPKIASNQELADAYASRLSALLSEADLLDSLKERFPSQPLKVISIGCGDTPVELEALTQCGFDFTYVGLDISSQDIDHCRKIYAGVNGVEFFQADCADLERIKEIAESASAQIVILRHPVLLGSDPVSKAFHQIISSTIPYLLIEGGALLVSLYHPEEKEACLQLLEQVTETQPIELSELKSAYIATEVQPGFLGFELDLYSNRFFVAYLDFKLSPALQAERKNISIDQDTVVLLRDYLFEKLTILSTQSLIENLLYNLIQKAKEFLFAGDDLSQFTNNLIAKLETESDYIANEKLISLREPSWYLAREKDFSNRQIQLDNISRILLSSVVAYQNNSDQFEKACYQGLQLLCARYSDRRVNLFVREQIEEEKRYSPSHSLGQTTFGF